MSLPFNQAQFLNVFQQYNRAVWPMQVVAYLLAATALGLARSHGPRIRWAVWSLLAFFWLWNGIAYHLVFFSAINKAAYAFGALFLLQSFLFVWMAFKNPVISFSPKTSLRAQFGSLLIVYAMLVYPLLGAAFGHGYPLSPSFGLAPCPTVIFTFGLLLWAQDRVPASLLVIPFLWSLVGFTAALRMGIPEDIGLLVAGLVGVPLLWLAPPGRSKTRESRTQAGPESGGLPGGAVS